MVRSSTNADVAALNYVWKQLTRRPLRSARRVAGRLAAWSVLSALLVPFPAWSDEALVAVATNFADVAQILETDFERSNDHRLTIATGSSGKLYAQILQGAPFDALLAADRERPRLLERAGIGVAGTRFVYATGRLALWSRDESGVDRDGRLILKEGRFRSLAIANPELAPYGTAALQTLGPAR